MMVMNRRMLSRDEENPEDVEVSRADQDQINRFSTLHQKHGVLQEELKKRQQEKEYITDITGELELTEEDDLVPYKIGDAFVNLPLPEVRKRLESSADELDTEIEKLEGQMETAREEREELKVGLYAKFGKAINLEV